MPNRNLIAKRIRPNVKKRSGAGRSITVCLALAAITWAVFDQTLWHPFVNFDDQIYVSENARVLRGLSFSNIGWAFTHSVGDNWHPLTVISHMLDCQVFGANAGGHHFTNVLLHTVAVLLCFGVVRRLTGTFWRSAIVAALFAIHPLHVESVAWVAERKDVLSAVFFFLTLGSYGWYREQPSAGRYIVVVVTFALGLMTKPMLVTVPFVLLLIDYWPLGRFNQRGRKVLRTVILEKVPLLCLSIGSCIATLLVQQRAIVPVDQLSIGERASNAALAVATYLWQSVWPTKLTVFYPLPQDGVALAHVTFSVLMIVAISAGVILLRKTQPYLVTGWCWFVGMLVPVLGLVQVGVQAHADRYTYLPHVGLYIAIVWLTAAIPLTARRRELIFGCVTTIVLAGLIFRAWTQTTYWRDSRTLWTHALAVTANNDTAQLGLSDLSFAEGKIDDAVLYARQALSIRPANSDANIALALGLTRKGETREALQHFEAVERRSPHRPRLHYNMGTLFLDHGEVDRAISEFEKEISIYPEMIEAQNNLGTALMRKGQFDEALSHFERTAAQDPTRPKLHANIAMAWLQKGEPDKAIQEFEKELRRQPFDAQTQNDLGAALLQKGDPAAALAQWHKALRLQPNNINALCNAAWTFATCSDREVRDGGQAVEFAQRALDLAQTDDPRILRVLAAAHAEKGEFATAIEVAQRAVKRAANQGDATLKRALEGNIDQYQRGLPLREKHS